MPSLCSELDKDEFIQCPYDRAHMVPQKKMSAHIFKCRKNYHGKDYVTCPFNAHHIVPQPEYRYHLLRCPDKRAMEAEISRMNGKAPNGSPHQFLDVEVTSSENWDSELLDRTFELNKGIIVHPRRVAQRKPTGLPSVLCGVRSETAILHELHKGRGKPSPARSTHSETRRRPGQLSYNTMPQQNRRVLGIAQGQTRKMGMSQNADLLNDRESAQQSPKLPPGLGCGQSNSTPCAGMGRGQSPDSALPPGMGRGQSSDSALSAGMGRGKLLDSTFAAGNGFDEPPYSTPSVGKGRGQSDSTFSVGTDQDHAADSTLSIGTGRGQSSDSALSAGKGRGQLSDPASSAVTSRDQATDSAPFSGMGRGQSPNSAPSAGMVGQGQASTSSGSTLFPEPTTPQPATPESQVTPDNDPKIPHFRGIGRGMNKSAQ